MSYLLNHTDNNRSEDDEDDHINRLFPKCKPRTSSVSLSPSLQHLEIPTSKTTSTSASDLCLNSTSLFFSLADANANENERVNNNSNLTHQKDCIVINRYSKRKLSANSNNLDEDLLLNSPLQNHPSLWGSEESSLYFSQERQTSQSQFLYENNNLETGSHRNCTAWANSSQSTEALSSSSSHCQRSSGGSKESKKCEINHNIYQKPLAKGNCDTRRTSSSATSQQSPRTLHDPSNTYLSPKTESSFSRSEKKQRQTLGANLVSVIPHRPQDDGPGPCSAKIASGSLQSLITLLDSSSHGNMEPNPMEDNFDNGIGSGCSRSSGESTHSNTSDFMENLVSPVGSLHGRVVASGNGGTVPGSMKGHPNNAAATAVLTPSTGTLRDSRIEIAGGREIFSQNRIRATRRHRSSSHAMQPNEIMTETAPCSHPSSNKMRKKSLHTHTPYQHQHQPPPHIQHHCCHSSPCCGTPVNCPEVGLPPHAPMMWEANHSGSCHRALEVVGTRPPPYLSHSHSFGGGGGPGQCVKCRGVCGSCGHPGFEYSPNAVKGAEFTEGRRICRNVPKLHDTSPTSPMSLRETIFASEVRCIEKPAPRGSQVEKCSTVHHCDLDSPCRIESVIYEVEAVDGDGKVVFDDIGEWRERHGGGDNGGYEAGDEHDTSESQGSKKRQMQACSSTVANKDRDNQTASSGPVLARSKRPSGFGLNNPQASECSPCASNRDGNTTPSGYESDECSATACPHASILTSRNLKSPNHFGNKKLIGNIAIAEYEGSPKRYGLKQTAHPVTTHFDLIEVDMRPETLRRAENEVVVISDSSAQTLVEDQTIAAATSSSSSSLDNTNTNVSSNSSSRTNNRVSPRALSPASQPISSVFSTKFPGFPQRVNANPISSPSSQERPSRQPCPALDYDPRNLGGSNHELLSLGNSKDSTIPTSGESKVLMVGGELAGASPQFRPVSSEQLIRIESSPPVPLGSSGSLNHGESPSHCNASEHCNSCSLLEENFMIDPSSQLMRCSNSDHRNQDFLYEFSETRKVLEEFFSGASSSFSAGGMGHGRAETASFDELDYMLRRQAGNSYVGQRLASDVAGNIGVEAGRDSPAKKPPRRGLLLIGSCSEGDGSDEKGSPKLISFQEISLPEFHQSQSQSQSPQQGQNGRGTQSLTTPSARSPPALKTHSRSESQSPPLHDPTRDINDNDIDAETASTNTETDLGETEVGLQVGRRRPNFGVSPETTDCDSNELESELSIDYDASLHSSSCRVRRGRRVRRTEDGLSSGNESENEEIIEVDVGLRDDGCYLMGSKIKPCPTQAKRQNDMPNDAKLLSSEENKENILSISKVDASLATNILSWSTSDDLILGLQDGSSKPPQCNNASSGEPNPTLMLMKKQISEIEKEIQLRASQQMKQPYSNGTGVLVDTEIDMNETVDELPDSSPSANGNPPLPHNKLNGRLEIIENKNSLPVEVDSVKASSHLTTHDPELDALDPMRPTPPPSPAPSMMRLQQQHHHNNHYPVPSHGVPACWKTSDAMNQYADDLHYHESYRSEDGPLGCGPSYSGGSQLSQSPPSTSVAAAIQDIKEAIQRAKPLPNNSRLSSSSTSSSVGHNNGNSRTGLLESQHSPESHEHVPLNCDSSPVWVPRHPRCNRNRDPRADSQGAKDPLLKKQRYEDTPDDDADTDQETDRLLGQTRTEDDCGFYDEKEWKKPKSRSLLPVLNKGVAFVKSATSVPSPAPHLSTSASLNASGGSGPISTPTSFTNANSNNSYTILNNVSSLPANNASSLQLSPSTSYEESQQRLLPSTSLTSSTSAKPKKEKDGVKKKRSKEDILNNPSVLIEGVLFRAKYLGSTQLTCEGQPTKATRMMQAEEAVSRIKAESCENGTNELQQGPKSSIASSSPGSSAPATKMKTTTVLDSPQALSITSNIAPRSMNEFEESGVSSLNNPIRRNDEENSGEMEDYFYGIGEDEESCCEADSDGDEDLFVKVVQKSRGSLGSLRDNKGMRLPLEDVHGSSNALQIHDNHPLPLSLHHRRGSAGNGDACPGVGGVTQPAFLNLSPPCASALPGTMFRLRFIGSMEVDEEIGTGKRRRKRPKAVMVEEAVMKMKSMAPEGETQPSTEVDLFISTEKIMVLNTDLKEIMMDHALRTISYIADIGDLVVLMARRRPVPTDTIDETKPPRLPKMICHVFESDEAQYIAQSIGQAFQVAYMEFLKANGIEDSSFIREMDYQEVLNSQEIFGDELQMFAKKELQKEVVVPKTKGEILGVVIVESGWGSMLPTVVIANLAPAGAAARCGQLNIGDQIIAINGISLVGLPLSTCQNYIKNTKNQTVVKLTVVPCPPVVEVKIKRPDTKYQLGFSVQNGVICSLLRGGIAERGGVRVGHRIIEINSQSVVAVPHEKIVNLLATSVGEINMKTMPTSMFRLLTGQETPLYI